MSKRVPVVDGPSSGEDSARARDGGHRTGCNEDGQPIAAVPSMKPRRNADDSESPNTWLGRIERDMVQRIRPRFLKPRASGRRTA